MGTGLPLWRSLLYVPVNVEKYVDKAHTRGADCIQLDLEDSVPEAEKEHARSLVQSAAARVRRGGADAIVRINRPLSMAVIETPAAFFGMPAIAASSARLVGMNIGGEDFATEVGMEPTEETLLMPKQQMILAARAAGLIPLGFIASVASFGDWDAFRAMVHRSRAFGFMGASCIHPGQVPIVNQEFSPSEAELAFATRVVDGAAAEAASGRGSFAIDGKMIDVPVVRRAQQLLDRHAAIEAREANAARFVKRDR
jgi:citrate lyase subunit beta/citryl-CoA lyase